MGMTGIYKHSRTTWQDITIRINSGFFKNSFFNVHLFLREGETERETKRQSMSGGGAETGEDTESEVSSRLWAVSTEPDAGLGPMNREIVTWAVVGHLTESPRHPKLRILKQMIFGVEGRGRTMIPNYFKIGMENINVCLGGESTRGSYNPDNVYYLGWNTPQEREMFFS